jgi:hypothetical protein
MLRAPKDLENPSWLLFQVVFGVPDTGAGAHHLHVSGFGSAFIAETVLVRHRAFANVGDDFHVRVRVRRKARVGRDLVVVPDAQRAPTHSRGIDIVCEGEMVLGLQPAVIFSPEFVEWSVFDDPRSSGQWPCFADTPMDTAMN